MWCLRNGSCGWCVTSRSDHSSSHTGGLVSPTDRPTISAMRASRINRAKAMIMYFCQVKKKKKRVLFKCQLKGYKYINAVVLSGHMWYSVQLTWTTLQFSNTESKRNTYPSGFFLVSHSFFGFFLCTANVFGCIGDVLLDVVHHFAL